MKALKQNFSVFFIMLTLFIFLGGNSLLFSQQQKKTDEIMGAIAGIVKDEENYLLPGITVEATRPDVRSKVIDITDEKGHFRLSNLLPGTYTVTFSCPGFKTVEREGIIVQSGSTFDLNETMIMAILEHEPIVVYEQYPIVGQEKSETWKLEKQNKELAQKIFEAWGKGDFETFKEFLAPEYLYFSPSISSKTMSREESIEMGKMLRKAFPDISWSMEELIAEEDRVITRWVFRGTHQGEFMGIQATGNKVEVSGIIISRIENGKVVEDREEFDMLGLMMQLGMELKPKEGEK